MTYKPKFEYNYPPKMIEGSPTTGATHNERKPAAKRTGEFATARRVQTAWREIRRIQETYLDEYPTENPENLEFTSDLRKVAFQFIFDDRELSRFGTAAVTIGEDDNSSGETEKRRDIVIKLKRNGELESGVREYEAKKSGIAYLPAGHYKDLLADKDLIRPIKPAEIDEILNIIDDLTVVWDHLKTSSF